jgi:hypothetical protein
MLVVAAVVLDIIVVVKLVHQVELVVEEKVETMTLVLEQQEQQTQVVAVEAVVDQIMVQIIEMVLLAVVE